ncbi:class F sortase [Nakamurella flava]|uniref:Class F sortase n=1 Tax=Nakamurella flava TaxID=2576308 RepID=A0A4U6QJU8_9ACTN|nr:class F sortase [Nakamurella flava]TKV60372.1 class F sortase [Nakamurella flava]
MSLALGVALMTGVQLAEARTVTGSGDFSATAPAPRTPASGPAAPGAASPDASTSTAPTSSADAAPTSPSSAVPTPAAAIPAAPTSDSSSAAPSTQDPAPAPAPTTPSPTAAAPVPAGIPVGFALPRLDVQAPIDPVGQVDGELEVPEDIRRLGWWTGSAAAGGSAGTTVLDGHIDSPQGRGVFFHLQEVEPDDEVVLTVAGGATVTYKVTERRSYHKADGLPAEVFASTDQPKLVLITCGGRYDFAQASYDDNIVVIAVPA